jgi:hypothetical protein
MTRLILSILFFAISIFAQTSASNINVRRQLLLQDSPTLTSFNGTSFDGTSLGDARTAISKQTGSTVDLNYNKSSESSLQLSNSNYQYKLSWKRADPNDPNSDLRMNQLYFDKGTPSDPTNPPHVKVVTSTFSGNDLRSMTLCEGSKIGSTATDGKVYCATATNEICRKVRTAYVKTGSLQIPGASTKESLDASKKAVSTCMKTMRGYADILKAFSPIYENETDKEKALHNANDGSVKQNYEKRIVKGDDNEASRILSSVQDPDFQQIPVSINSMTGEAGFGLKKSDFDKTAEDLTSSMHGLQQVSDFVSMCFDHANDFGNSTQVKPLRQDLKQNTSRE